MIEITGARAKRSILYMNQTRAASQPLPAEMWSRQHSEIILTFVGLEFIGETRSVHPRYCWRPGEQRRPHDSKSFVIKAAQGAHDLQFQRRLTTSAKTSSAKTSSAKTSRSREVKEL
jgi:hypothetical protein